MSYLTKTKEEQQTVETFAKAFIRETNLDLQNIAKRFFIIGFRLQEAVKMDYVTALGYQNIEELAENEFGFKRSTTYGLMQVYNRTCKYDGFRGTMEMQDKYKEYNYSQLLEISKMKYIDGDIREKIAPSDTVRDIQAYVRFWNEYGNKNSTTPDCSLSEWKARQIKEENPENNGQLTGQVTLEELDNKQPKDIPQITKEKTKTKIINVTKSPSAPVQTSGLRTPAKVDNQEKNKTVICSIQTFTVEELTQMIDDVCKTFDERIHIFTTQQLWLRVVPCVFADQLYDRIARYLGEKSYPTLKHSPTNTFNSEKYTLQNRKGVRDFLADYQNWTEDIGFKNFFFHKVYSCLLKNKTYIYACERKIYNDNTKEYCKAETKVTYYFNAFKGDGVTEISQNQFEQYCNEYKDEL